MRTQLTRPAAVAGAFYPGRAAQLQQMIQTYLDAATPPALTGVRAVIAPHAGYVYSGPIAAFCYKLLADQPPPARIILLGPAHRVWFHGVALADYDAFQTPLGELPVARAAMQQLKETSDLFQSLSSAHATEHCLEVQLPFLQTIYPPLPIVPLLCGEVSAAAVGEALDGFLEPDDLLIISSDLSHYHPYDDAQRRDRSFIDAVLRDDSVAVARGEACGQTPILALMTIARRRGWQPHLLDYRNSGDTAGDRQQVVGYAAIAYTEV